MFEGRDVSRNKAPQIEVKEGHEAVMEKASEGRRRLLKNIFTSRAMDLGANFIPGVDIIKMSTEAVVGKTSSGQKLSRRERFDYTLIAGGVALSYALAMAGMQAEAGYARGAAGVISKIEFTPAMIREAYQKIQEKSPKTAHFLEQIADFAKNKVEETKRIVADTRELILNPQAGLEMAYDR